MTAHKLPEIAFTKSLLFVGAPGSGKSYNAAENRVVPSLEKRQQVVIIDPTDAWYGLRYSKSGKRSSGYDIAIFGGEHGDVPLTPNMGRALGELLGSKPISAILSMQHFELSEQIHFMSDFAAAIMKANRKPINLIIDEADEFIPQKPEEGGELMKCKGRCKRIVTRGRKQGFRPVLITQRPQVLDTSVRNLSQVLVALQCPGIHERKMIDEYVKSNGDPAAVSGMLATLAGLDVGEAWVWAPRGGVLERVKFGALSVFDSFKELDETSTPVEVVKLDDAHLGIVRGALAKFEEDRKANDPDELRRALRIANEQFATVNREKVRLLADLAAEQGKPRGATAEDLKKCAGASYALGFQAGYREGHTTAVSDIEDAFKRAGKYDAARATIDAHKMMDELQAKVLSKFGTPIIDRARAASAALPPTPAQLAGMPIVNSSKPSVIETPPDAEDRGPLAKPEKKILASLGWWFAMGHGRPTRPQVAMIAGYSHTSTSFTNPLSSLSKRGFIVYPEGGLVQLTDAGAQAAEPSTVERTRAGLQKAVLDQLNEPQTRILKPALAEYPSEISREDLAAAASYSHTSTSFTNPLSSLSVLGLVEYPTKGRVKACAWLFP